jgi:hypothetical protein
LLALAAMGVNQDLGALFALQSDLTNWSISSATILAIYPL